MYGDLREIYFVTIVEDNVIGMNRTASTRERFNA